MKKFFEEFKKFITRGNVLDMAVGVIVGGAFTAIVNALSNNILKPVINFLLALILGKDSLSEVYTVLLPVFDDAGVLDLTQSIYIDWGAFINAIINFLLIAIVLFSIVKIINTVAEASQKANKNFATQKEAVQKYRAEGLSKKEAVARYLADLQAAEAAAKAEEEAKAAEEARIAEEKATINTRLLEEIRDILKTK